MRQSTGLSCSVSHTIVNVTKSLYICLIVIKASVALATPLLNSAHVSLITCGIPEVITQLCYVHVSSSHRAATLVRKPL